MPYIAPQERAQFELNPQTPGQLNYAITMLLKWYLNRKGLTYTHINDCLGALEGAKLEFYRRVVVPYEQGRIAENGDIY